MNATIPEGPKVQDSPETGFEQEPPEEKIAEPESSEESELGK